ncbi:MAG: hypothetical protein PHP93_03400 [Kiritimatiellales bacterium]|nr:hypothetical protein [Kiritimatiellales bacterium]
MILLYKGKSFVSWRIKMCTLGPYSHAAWLKTTQTLRDMIRIAPDSEEVKQLIIEAGCIESWEGCGARETYSLKSGHTPGTPIDVYDLPDMEEFKFSLVESHLRQYAEKKLPYWYKGILYARFNTYLNHAAPVDENGHLTASFCSMMIEDGVRSVDYPTTDLHRPVHGIWPTLLADSIRTKLMCTVTI